MPVLHIVRRSPFDCRSLSQCASRASAEDTIILIENAVYALLKPDCFAEFPTDIGIYALLPDLIARGLAADTTKRRITTIDFAGMVDLTVKFPLALSW